MLQCIIYRRQQVVNDVLFQCFIFKKGFAKYDVSNGIIPMKTQVDFAHPRLFAQRKLVLKFFINEAISNWQLRKKRFGPSGRAITSFFGATNLYKKGDDAYQNFFEDLMLYICKGYKPFSTCENMWLQKLVLRQCPCVVLPFHFAWWNNWFLQW